jgi:DNA-directed RNA polymerase subunit M/transcription elongation factor TFIIS
MIKIEVSNEKNGNEKKLHCGKCGREVPFEKKFISELVQTKVKNKSSYLVFVSYCCGICATRTSVTFHFSKPIDNFIKKFSLYNQ